jgi:hypothetical protein
MKDGLTMILRFAGPKKFRAESLAVDELHVGDVHASDVDIQHMIHVSR